MSKSENFDVSVSHETLSALHDLMTTGDYASPDDAIAAALQAWRQDNDTQAHLRSIQRRVTLSLGEEGADLSIDEVDEALDAMMDEALRVSGRAAG